MYEHRLYEASDITLVEHTTIYIKSLDLKLYKSLSAELSKKTRTHANGNQRLQRNLSEKNEIKGNLEKR